MTSIVTGANGFIGSHLVDFLKQRGDQVVAVSRSPDLALQGVSNRILDILDTEAVASLIKDFQPDYVYHLAAQSLPGNSWKDPKTTFRINVEGTLNLLDALVETGTRGRMIFASSSSVYAQSTGSTPLREDGLTLPTSPYGVSKLAAEQLVSLYSLRHGLDAVIARPFFLIGTRKTGDVCSDWARKIVSIEKGALKELSIGNLGVVRDFLSIEDGIAAMCLLAEKGVSGKAYNICSGAGYELTHLLETFRSLTDASVLVRSDPNLKRPIDEPIRIGDPSLLQGLGWRQKDHLKETLHKILGYWRSNSASR